MKFTKTGALLLSSLAIVSAQFGGEPDCATACLSSAVQAIGCQLSDVGCQCAPAAQASLVGVAGGCLVTACPATALLAIQSIGNALCLQYSAALTASTSGLTTVTTTVAATPASTTTSTVTSTTIASSSSSFPTLNSTSFANTTTAKSTSTAVILTTAPPTTTAPVTTASPLSSLSHAGAVGVAAGSIGGLVAAVMGALALL